MFPLRAFLAAAKAPEGTSFPRASGEGLPVPQPPSRLPAVGGTATGLSGGRSGETPLAGPDPKVQDGVLGVRGA